jgi:DNA-binding NarL/FixJ family response regulator
MRVFAEIAAGEWDLAESDAETMIRRAGGTVYDPRRVGAAGLRSVVHTLRGEVEEAARVLRDATEGGPVTTRVDFGAFGMYMLGIGMLAAAGGQFDMVAVALVELGAQFGSLTPPPLSILIEPEVVAARPTEIQAITSSLAATFGPANRLVRALDARVRGLAAEARAEPDAAGPLAEAAELFAGLAMPFDRARTLLDLGRVQRDPEPALEALTIFDHLGARLYGERTRELLRSLGVRPPPRRRQPKTTGTLSARELDVARLVAGGMSNREIAASLVVSVRTVTSHLDHMYAKLGIRSRATLTRYVIERGLVT